MPQTPRQCTEVGCRAPLDVTDEGQMRTKLCEKCQALSFADECKDKGFAAALTGAMASGNYAGLFETIIGGTRS